jgi:hypothetical protein
MPTQRTATVIALCAFAVPVRADVTVWQKGDSYLDLNMLVQVQGRYVWASGAGTTPDGATVFFRRLRPAISGAIDRNWYGIIEVDFGPGFEGEDPKTSVEHAFLEYSGFEDNQQSALKIGSIDPAFGREFLTSGAKLLTLEQTFNGIHWYGTPDMTMGTGFTFTSCDRKLSAQVVVGMMSIKQEPDRIWFQSPQNQTDNSDNTGYLASGRVDFWPIGKMPVDARHPATLAFDPNDLHRTDGWHVLASIGGYGWWNNNANNPAAMACPTTNDNVCPNGLANVHWTYGGELSAELLGYGFTADVEYQRIQSALEDRTFDGGLYFNGAAGLNKLVASAGYMVYADILELVGNFSLLTATNFPSSWYSSRLGLNWFIREHTIQLSAEGTYNENAFGTTGAHEELVRIQAQLAW